MVAKPTLIQRIMADGAFTYTQIETLEEAFEELTDCFANFKYEADEWKDAEKGDEKKDARDQVVAAALDLDNAFVALKLFFEPQPK